MISRFGKLLISRAKKLPVEPIPNETLLPKQCVISLTLIKHDDVINYRRVLFYKTDYISDIDCPK